MKIQKTLLALALFIATLSFGQITTNPGTGNVSIGTTTDNTIDKLQISGTASGSPATSANQFTTKAQLDLKADDNNVVKLTGNQTKTGILTMNSSAGYPGAVAAGLVLTTTGPSGQSISLTNNGGGQSIYSVNNANIGINSQNINPNGSGIYSNNLSTGKGIYSVNNAGGHGIFSNNISTGMGIFSNNTSTGMGIYSNNASTGQGIYSTNNSTGNGIVSNAGTSATGYNYVGQNNGTNTFTVSKTGTIHATEIKVTQTIPADYVFQKYYTGKSELKSDYVMPTLAEIEIFTKKNNHLPNVPSAKEMQQNGVSLGEMSNVLLQKIEELTLYAIEQNKYAIEQNKTIATLAARLASLEKK